ncbi:MAG: Uma2 family endonuclease [Chloroflexota bacterium]
MLYTTADLEALYDLPENRNKRFELFNGIIYEKPLLIPFASLICSTLIYHIGNYLVKNPIGFGFGALQYALPNGDVLIPDVSFVSKQSQPALPSKFTIAPDLAIEVFSPGNRERQMSEKVESYLRSGTQRVWVIYPESKVVEVYRLSPDGGLLFHTFNLDATLDGESILPGLKIAVRDVFPS